jgi:hypothetical protein
MASSTFADTSGNIVVQRYDNASARAGRQEKRSITNDPVTIRVVRRVAAPALNRRWLLKQP